jgi:hypothetical protein
MLVRPHSGKWDPPLAGGCTTLAAFVFPPTLRELKDAFTGTSIAAIDLSGTAAERATIGRADSVSMVRRGSHRWECRRFAA